MFIKKHFINQPNEVFIELSLNLYNSFLEDAEYIQSFRQWRTAGAIFNRKKLFPPPFIACEISAVLEKEGLVVGREILCFRNGAVKVYSFLLTLSLLTSYIYHVPHR
jgi:hypothetical protein